MKADEFKLVLAVAKSDVELDYPEDYTCPQLLGCGLEGFEPATCSFRQAVAFVRYQAQYLFGGWDELELSNLYSIFVRRRRLELSDLTLPEATRLWTEHAKRVLAGETMMVS